MQHDLIENSFLRFCISAKMNTYVYTAMCNFVFDDHSSKFLYLVHLLICSNHHNSKQSTVTTVEDIDIMFEGDFFLFSRCISGKKGFLEKRIKGYSNLLQLFWEQIMQFNVTSIERLTCLGKKIF
jgi:hypothetical protein